MGIRCVKASPEVMRSLWQHGSYVAYRVEQGLPADATLVGASVDQHTSELSLWWASAEWSPTLEGAEHETLRIVCSRPDLWACETSDGPPARVRGAQ